MGAWHYVLLHRKATAKYSGVHLRLLGTRQQLPIILVSLVVAVPVKAQNSNVYFVHLRPYSQVTV